MSDKRNRKHPRYQHRARSHESAHAHALESAPIPEHPLIPRDGPSLITGQEDLARLVDELRSAGSFAYDSEFIGELSYHPKLCLIQTCTPKRVALIDTLAALDLADFWRLLADPAVEKIVHAGEQDLEPVLRHVHVPPANIFDTQVAAGFIGLSYPAGLSKIVRELIGVPLGKAFTLTHWDQRPLSNVQIRYAADDVRYLPAVRAAIGERLAELGHAAGAAEESAALCDPARYATNPGDGYKRLRGASGLAPRNAAVLRELVIWRQSAAQRHDSPPRSYVRDQILLDMARNPVPNVAGLDRVRGLPRPVESAEGENIIEAIQRGLATPKDDMPVIEQLDETPAERFAADGLWATVQAWCHGHQIDPNLVSSRQEIARFWRDARDGKPIGETRLLKGWRGEFIGRMLNEFIEGRREATIAWAQGSLRAK